MRFSDNKRHKNIWVWYQSAAHHLHTNSCYIRSIDNASTQTYGLVHAMQPSKLSLKPGYMHLQGPQASPLCRLEVTYECWSGHIVGLDRQDPWWRVGPWNIDRCQGLHWWRLYSFYLAWSGSVRNLLLLVLRIIWFKLYLVRLLRNQLLETWLCLNLAWLFLKGVQAV